MALLIILLVGMLVGWLASAVTGTGGGLLFDMVAGIVGALVAGWLFGGGASILSGAITLTSIAASVLGAIIVLLVVGLVRGRRFR